MIYWPTGTAKNIFQAREEPTTPPNTHSGREDDVNERAADSDVDSHRTLTWNC